MKRIKYKKTILISFFSIGVALFYFNFYFNQAILSLINKNSNRTYNIKNNEISFSLLNQSITFTAIKVKQLNQQNTTNSVLNASVKTIKIKGFSIYNLIIHNRIRAENIIIDSPLIHIQSSELDKKVVQNSKSINLFWQDILNNAVIQNITIINGEITTYKQQDIGFSSKNMNISLQNVTLNKDKTNTPLPFLYSRIQLDIGKTYAKIGALYETTIGGFKATNSSLSVKKIEVRPMLNLHDFNSRIKTEQDYTEVEIDNLDFENTQWTFISDTVYVKASKVTLKNSNTTLHRNKYIKDDTSTKNLYSKVIRDLPFYITIDSFQVNNGALTYKELQNDKQNYGEINFKHISMQGEHINNYRYKQDSAKTRLKFQALFLGHSRINANYSFATKNKLDQYTLTGKLVDFNTADFNILTKPMFNIKTTGTIKELNFKINGNDIDASANVKMVYKDLKLIYGNNKGKDKIISKIANLIMKNERDINHAKTVTVYVKRDQQKSMYNHIIKCFVEAVKKTII